VIFAAFLCFWAGSSVASALVVSAELLSMVTSQYGRGAAGTMIDGQTMVDENVDSDETQKLRAVNRFFNKTRFLSDPQHWHMDDYWATPVEFLSTRGGDCEDFAIAKYLTLLALDVPDSKLRITYVKYLRTNQAHMVLTYYASKRAEPLVLDNLVSSIKPASKRTDLRPVYSFNGSGLWLAKMQSEGSAVGTADDLDMWQDFTTRLQREKSYQ
jgi:predicted transglutaminase-like cysteine proteinase